MILKAGDRVIYKSGILKRGFEQPEKEATVIAHLINKKTVRIRCDGEKVRRNVREKFIRIKNA